MAAIRKLMPVLAPLTLALALALPAGATAASGWGGASADGSRAFFVSQDRLVPEDADDYTDVYEASGGTVKLLSTGPGGSNGAHNAQFAGASADGSRVFFTTTEALAEGDADPNRSDIYMRAGGTTTLVTPPGNSPFGPSFKAMSPDGSQVIFATAENIDGDEFFDLFRWSAADGTRTLLTPGTAGHVSFAGATPDLSRVFFESPEPRLAGSENDGNLYDVFETAGGAVRWLSVGEVDTEDQFNVAFQGASVDGSKVFLETEQRLTSSDGDVECPGGNAACVDVYEHSNGDTRLVSEPGSSQTASFAGASADGSRVFFHARGGFAGEAESGEDNDLYERSGGQTTLLTPGTDTDALFGGVSTDGTRIFFTTATALSGADVDAATDVYEIRAGTTTLVSPGGAGDFPVKIAGHTPDGSTLYYETREPLTGDDADPSGCFPPACTDVYATSGGATTLVSAPGTGANPGEDAVEARFLDATDDGAHVWFYTAGALAAGDPPGTDVFERFGGVTAGLAAGGVGTPPPPPQPPTQPSPQSPPPGPGAGAGEPVTPAPPPTTQLDLQGPTVVIPSSSKRLKATKAGVLRIKLGPMAESTSGEVQLKTAKKVRVGGKRRVVAFGTKSFQALGGQTVTVKLTLSKANRKLLRRLKKVKVRAVVTLRDQAGNTTIERFAATLRR